MKRPPSPASHRRRTMLRNPTRPRRQMNLAGRKSKVMKPRVKRLTSPKIARSNHRKIRNKAGNIQTASRTSLLWPFLFVVHVAPHTDHLEANTENWNRCDQRGGAP